MELFTACCRYSQLLLKDDEHKKIVLQSLAFLCKDQRIRLYGYVILEDEFHVLWEKLPDWKTKNIRQMMLKYTAQQIKHRLLRIRSPILEEYRSMLNDRHYHFWDQATYFTPISSPEMAAETICLLHEAPVLSGLCASPEKYPFSSAGFYHKKYRTSAPHLLEELRPNARSETIIPSANIEMSDGLRPNTHSETGAYGKKIIPSANIEMSDELRSNTHNETGAYGRKIILSANIGMSDRSGSNACSEAGTSKGEKIISLSNIETSDRLRPDARNETSPSDEEKIPFYMETADGYESNVRNKTGRSRGERIIPLHNEIPDRPNVRNTATAFNREANTMIKTSPPEITRPRLRIVKNKGTGAGEINNKNRSTTLVCITDQGKANVKLIYKSLTAGNNSSPRKSGDPPGLTAVLAPRTEEPLIITDFRAAFTPVCADPESE